MVEVLKYETDYGSIKVYKDDYIFVTDFEKGVYPNGDELKWVATYIPRDKNILEIGGHIGTSTIYYAKLIVDNQKLYVFEPQERLFELLEENISDNNLSNKIEAYNQACFYFNGEVSLNVIPKLIKHRNYNYGYYGIGSGSMMIDCIKLDDLNIKNVGFIHIDSQGSENFIFYGAQEMIKKNRPVILYENKEIWGDRLHNKVKALYPKAIEESEFNIKKYCMDNLDYSEYIHNFNGGINSLLIP